MDIGNLLKQEILMYEEQGNEYTAKRKQIEKHGISKLEMREERSLMILRDTFCKVYLIFNLFVLSVHKHLKFSIHCIY